MHSQGRFDETCAAYREAIRLKPDYAEPHCNLGKILQGRGLFTEALGLLEKGHALGSRRPDWQYPSARWVGECRRLVELDGKLPAILRGEDSPKDAGERLELADLCVKKTRYAAAARFFGEAFAERPALADDLARSYRYDAACAAALAGSGAGKDDPPPDDEVARAKLREQARGWLRADLASWTKVLEGGDEPARKKSVVETMDHWKTDADLAGIRDESALAKLPDGEREAFRALWVEVEALRQKAAGGGGR